MRMPHVRLSVRTMMALVLVAGGLLGVVHRAHLHQENVAAIRQTGTQVYYNWQCTDGRPTSPEAKSPWPKWITDAVGFDYLADVVAIDLSPIADDSLLARVGKLGRLRSIVLVEGQRITDGGLAPLGELRRLEHLNLPRCQSISDGGLARLRNLAALRTLQLDGTQVTGNGLSHLGGMTHLEDLVLPDGPIDDADLKHLKGLTSLKRLQIRGLHPTISNRGLSQLKALVNLELIEIHSPKIISAGLDAFHDMNQIRNLAMSGCGITDIAPIGHLTKLTSLNLSGNPIDDAGLAPIREFKEMENLHLIDTWITDAGLIHLSGLNKVRTLFLDGTKVTDHGITRLSGLDACHQITLKGEDLSDAGIKAAERNKPGTHFIRMSR